MNIQESKAIEADAETVEGEKGCCGGGVMSSREKNLVIIGLVFGLLVLCLLTAIIMAIVIESLFPKQEYCLTEHCVKKAGSILRSMNQTADPCTDFFSYACGGWIEQYDVDDESEIAVLGRMQRRVYRKFDRIIENINKADVMKANMSTDNKEEIAYAGVKAIKTYEACTKLYDYNSTTLVKMMTKFGGWPMGTENWNDAFKPNEEQLSFVLGDFGVPSLLAISVTPDENDPQNNVISISPPGVALVSEEYWQVIQEIAKETNNDAARIDTDVESLQSFYDNINKFAASRTEEKENTVVKELEAHLNSNMLDFVKLIELLVYGKTLDMGNADKNKLSEAKVVINDKDAINSILSEADSKDGRLLNNYFAVNVLTQHPLLMANKLEPAINTQQTSNALNVLAQLKEVCIQTVAQYLTFAMDHVFVYKQEKDTGMAKHLIQYIRGAFTKFIGEYNWLDLSTRSKLKIKLEKMNEFVDYPDWLNDKKKVDEYYKDYKYNDASNIEAYFDMVKFAVRKMYAGYDETNDRSKWPNLAFFSVSTVNAFYIPTQNNFVLPRAILNPPIYDERNPKYLTYGSIGAIIGHEITHGFDSTGRHYDENGKLSKDLWSNHSALEYKKLSDCFVHQYNKYVIDQNVTVDGNKTLGENIADNGGLREAYRAYNTWLKEFKRGRKEFTLPGFAKFTPQQMFFISFGQTWCAAAGKSYLRKQVEMDEHTPNNYRVIGTLSNMKAFAEAFKCSTGSPMNPIKKCVLW